MCVHDETEREVYEIPKALFAEARAIDAEAEAIGLDPTFYLAEIRRDEAKRNGAEERYRHLKNVCDVMKTIEFAGSRALYILS